MSLAQDSNLITNDDLKTYYDECIKVLQDRVSFCFNGRKNSALTWKVSTWSKNIQPSIISSKGFDRDKSFLDVSTTRNNPRPFKRRKTEPLDTVGHRQRQNWRIVAGTNNTTTTTTTGTSTSTTIGTTTTTTNNNNNTNNSSSLNNNQGCCRTTTTNSSSNNNSANHTTTTTTIATTATTTTGEVQLEPVFL
jgi:hypothetical protein